MLTITFWVILSILKLNYTHNIVQLLLEPTLLQYTPNTPTPTSEELYSCKWVTYTFCKLLSNKLKCQIEGLTRNV